MPLLRFADIRQVTSSLNTGAVTVGLFGQFPRPVRSRRCQRSTDLLKVRSANKSASKNHSRNHDGYSRYPLREAVLKRSRYPGPLRPDDLPLPFTLLIRIAEPI